MVIEKIVVFIFGAVFGSFLNVCIYRLPKEKSIVAPPSSCIHCNKPIKWYDNIPLVSYILLRGKCRFCQGKISIRYLIVESLSACLFLFLYCQHGLTLAFFKFAFFFSLLIVVSFIDIDYHAIPVYLCFIGAVVGLLLSAYESFECAKRGDIEHLPIIAAFGNLIFGLGFTYCFKFFGDVLLGLYLSLIKKESIEGETESLGLGDVDFMGMAAIFLASKWLVATTFFIAPFVAMLYTIYALLFKKSHLIPYLPYLSVATFISYLWGAKLIQLLGFV